MRELGEMGEGLREGRKERTGEAGVWRGLDGGRLVSISSWSLVLALALTWSLFVFAKNTFWYAIL